MIKKSRLEQLIKEGATIWVRNDYQTYEINTSYFVNIDIIDNVLYCGAEMVCLDYLYETKKQAEWALNYHATRTETLSLPMWEEIITDDKYRYHYGLSFFDFDNYRLIVCVPNEDDNTEFIGIDVDGNTELYHWEEATEENYTKACDLCVKLFKGEK